MSSSASEAGGAAPDSHARGALPRIIAGGGLSSRAPPRWKIAGNSGLLPAISRSHAPAALFACCSRACDRARNVPSLLLGTKLQGLPCGL